jgi:hypothetical protein
LNDYGHSVLYLESDHDDRNCEDQQRKCSHGASFCCPRTTSQSLEIAQRLLRLCDSWSLCASALVLFLFGLLSYALFANAEREVRT